MTRAAGELLEVLQLRAAVAFTERMAVVHVADDGAGFDCEVTGRQSGQERFSTRRPWTFAMPVAMKRGLNMLPPLAMLMVRTLPAQL